MLVSFTLGKTWTIPLIKAQSVLGWLKKKKAALSNSFTFPRQQWKRRKYKVSEFPPEKEQLRPTILDQSPTQWLRDRTRTRTRPGPGSNTSILSSGPATPLKTASDWEWTASQWLTSWRSHDRDLENMHEKKEGFVFVCVSVCVCVSTRPLQRPDPGTLSLWCCFYVSSSTLVGADNELESGQRQNQNDIFFCSFFFCIKLNQFQSDVTTEQSEQRRRHHRGDITEETSQSPPLLCLQVHRLGSQQQEEEEEHKGNDLRERYTDPLARRL